jgi:hypothetical protein
VQFVRARAPHYLGRAGRGDAAAWQDGDRAGGPADQRREHVRPVERGYGATGGEQPVDAERQHVTESGERLGRLVEGAVECDAGRAGGGDQTGGQLTVDRSGSGERADDESGGTRCLRRRDVPQHDLHLGVRVDEVTAARPDQHMHGEAAGRGGDRPSGQPDARRDAACREVSAQFDPVGAGLDRG